VDPVVSENLVFETFGRWMRAHLGRRAQPAAGRHGAIAIQFFGLDGSGPVGPPSSPPVSLPPSSTRPSSAPPSSPPAGGGGCRVTDTISTIG
jgi:hypothetical protein